MTKLLALVMALSVCACAAEASDPPADPDPAAQDPTDSKQADDKTQEEAKTPPPAALPVDTGSTPMLKTRH